MKSSRGLSLLEILVIIVGLALVVAILLPSVQRPRRSNPRLRCGSNLRQQGMLMQMWAADHPRDALLSSGAFTSFCDQSTDFRDALLKYSSAASMPQLQRPFYCPTNRKQDPTALWQRAAISTWGYAWLNPRGPDRGALPESLPARTPPLAYRQSFQVPNPAQLEIALDVIVSDTLASAPNFSPANAPIPFGSSHFDSKTHRGANVLYLDNHVEWISFVQARATPVQVGQVWFWFPRP